MEKYIEVTQDGIGRISFSQTSDEITGLYTDGIQSCIAIILKGDRGISLVHDAGQIDRDTFDKELQWIGAFQTIAFVFNPLYEEDIFMTNINFLTELGTRDDLKETHTGCVSVDRNGVISYQVRSTENIQPLPDKNQRYAINYLHNLRYTKIPGDLQFDGQHFHHAPALRTSITDMRKWANILGDDQHTKLKTIFPYQHSEEEAVIRLTQRSFLNFFKSAVNDSYENAEIEAEFNNIELGCNPPPESIFDDAGRTIVPFCY